MNSVKNGMGMVLAVCIVLQTAVLTAATYYVNGTTGNDNHTRAQARDSATPWATVQTGADSAGAGDVVLVAPGRYTETVQVSGTDLTSGRLTFRGMDADNKPVMDGDSSNLYTRAFALTEDPNVTIENFEIRDYYTHGIQLATQSHGVIIRNCYIHHNNKSGISAENSRNLTVDSCLIMANGFNGIGFTKADSLTVRNCDITLNMGEAGIWVGGGTSGSFFMTSYVWLRNNYIHDQPKNDYHADNLQMHQVEKIWLENNVFMQKESQQNMWCQYTSKYYINNNIFLGGPLGINSCIYSYLFNNVFYKSLLRYDQHLTNHPNFRDYYVPLIAKILNNMIIESGIAWPSVGDKERTFTVDYNYFNSASSWTRQNWTTDGVGIGDSSIQHTSAAELAGVIVAEPDGSLENYDFHSVPGSWLRDHGTDVRYLPETDKAGNGRINNGRPDVGPYEYHTSGIIDRSVPGALPRIVKYTGPGALISLNAGPDTRTVVISDVTGRTAAVLEVKDGMAVLDPVRHGLPDGMYLVRTGDNTSLEKIILTR